MTDADGDEIRLTPTEWHIVEVLVRHAGKLVAQKQLLQEVWGPAYETETNYLRVFMAQVRRKLEPEPGRPRYFLTEPGMGYRFERPPSAEPSPSRRSPRAGARPPLRPRPAMSARRLALRRWRSTSITAGRIEMKMITAMIGSRYLSMFSSPICVAEEVARGS